MKYVHFILAMLFAVIGCQAQIFGPPDGMTKKEWQTIPRQERQELKKEMSANEALQEEFDYVIPERPYKSRAAIASTNWSLGYLGINQNAGRIASMMKGKVDCAILDTGFPDNKNTAKFASPKPPVSYTGEPPIDGHFHSTHVAGSQSAAKVGIANLLAEAGLFTQTYYKVCTNRGGCQLTWMEKSIRDYKDYYLKELKPNGIAGVINMSIGGPSMSSGLEKAMREATEAGITIFASAGNNGAVKISCPACSDYTFSVGAVGRSGEQASFSNQGPEQSFAGPGVGITSTCLGDTYCDASGTSMSGPQVAAVFILLKSIKPEWSPAQTISFMAEHAYDAGQAGFDDVYGYGIPKIGAYLDALEDEGPSEPRCNDGIRNGDEKGVDCGGSCPPCETEPPEGGCETRKETTAKLLAEGEWKMPWGYISTATAQEPFDFNPEQEMLVNFNADQTATIKTLEIEYTTRDRAPCSLLELQAAVDKFFVSRALGMPRRMDFSEVIKYTAYFLDLYAANKDFDIVVKRIEGCQDGVCTYLEGGDLLDWQKRTASEGGVAIKIWTGNVLWEIERTVDNPGLPSFSLTDYVVTEETVVIRKERDKPELSRFRAPFDGWQAVEAYR